MQIDYVFITLVLDYLLFFLIKELIQIL